jgi:hypothetical protein
VVHVGSEPPHRSEGRLPGTPIPFGSYLWQRDHFDLKVGQVATQSVGRLTQHNGLESATIEVLQQGDQVALDSTEGIALEVVDHAQRCPSTGWTDHRSFIPIYSELQPVGP